jgi:hypothetical protein
MADIATTIEVTARLTVTADKVTVAAGTTKAEENSRPGKKKARKKPEREVAAAIVKIDAAAAEARAEPGKVHNPSPSAGDRSKEAIARTDATRRDPAVAVAVPEDKVLAVEVTAVTAVSR